MHEITWAEHGRGNYWSDYAGYDADGDGIGDLPYRSQRLFESLADADPILRLFTWTPAASALDFAARAMPTIRPETKLTDEAPLMAPAVHPALPPIAAAAFVPRLELLLSGLTLSAAAAAAYLKLRLPLRRRPRLSLSPVTPMESVP